MTVLERDFVDMLVGVRLVPMGVRMSDVLMVVAGMGVIVHFFTVGVCMVVSLIVGMV